jgi:hypothetical protein
MSGAPGRGRSSVPLVVLLVVAAVVILGVDNPGQPLTSEPKPRQRWR